MPAGDKKPQRGQLGSSNKDGKKYYNAREKQLADELGGYRQPNSGALDNAKGDIKLDDFLLDLKETKSATMLVYAKDLNKISREALEVGKEPALLLSFSSIKGLASKEWVLISIDQFQEFVEK